MVFLISFGLLYWTGSAIWNAVPVGAWLWRRLPPLGGATSALQRTAGRVPYLLDVLAIVALAWCVDRGIRLLLRWVHWRRDVYAITSYRLIHQHGLWSTEFREIPLLQVRDVDVDQTFRMKVFGFGWVQINSLQTPVPGGSTTARRPHPRQRLPSDTVGLEEWLAVPDPYGIEREIESRTEALLASRTGTGAIGQSR